MVATGPIAASTQTFALGHLRPHAPPPKYLSGGNGGNGSTHVCLKVLLPVELSVPCSHT